MLTRNCLSLLLWVLFDGGLLTPLQPQPQHTLATEPRENVIHLPGQRSHVHRVKRGWVWNQFFVLEEYMGSEPQYVGKVMTCFFCQQLDSKGAYALCIVYGCFAQELNKPVNRTLELKSRDLVFLPDSMTRVSFGISFHPSLLQFSLVILMKVVYIILLFLTLFTKVMKLICVNVTESVTIVHYWSYPFWNCLPARNTGKNQEI